MEESSSIEALYYFYYIADNEIGVGGCKYLIQGNWENITALFLSNIDIIKEITQ